MSTRVCASENDGGRVKANDCQLNRISYLFSFVCVCVCFSSSLLCNEQKAYGTFNGYTLNLLYRAKMHFPFVANANVN